MKNTLLSFIKSKTTRIIPTNCSYVWRSILQAREVIQKGAIWRVGDGALINIWERRLLPFTASSKVLSPQGSSDVVWVKKLLVPNSGIWDSDLLDRTFIPWEAEEIKRIHVCAHGQNDAYIWPLTPDGNYSVHSAYRMLAMDKFSGEPASLNSNSTNQVWKAVRKIRAPNKVRHFIWRAVKDFLPIK